MRLLRIDRQKAGQVMIDQRIRIFLAVCEHGTMTGAAKALFMTQSAVSQTIALLEEQYQTKLFDRFPRRLELTEAGRVLKEGAQNMARFCDETEEKMRSSDKNATVRIGVNLSVGKVLIHEFLSQFRVNRPQAQVRINATRGAALCDLLKKGELDFLLMEETEEEDFIQEPFYKDRIVIVAAPDHPVWNRHGTGLAERGIRLADLADERFFLRERGAGVREQFDHLIQAHGLKINPAWESSSTGILVNALLHGEDGIAVLPYLLIRDELAEGKLKEIPVSDASLERTLFIVRHRSKHLTGAAEEFIKIVRNTDLLT